MDTENKIQNADKPAFPTNARMHSDAQGLIKREEFAKAAMHAYLSGSAPQGLGEDDAIYHVRIAAISIRAANELLKQLDNH
jgi:hypothetical protein